MIMSLKFTQPVSLHIDSFGKFSCAGEKMSIKETPVVRYAFEREEGAVTLSEQHEKFIKASIERFVASVHIVEVLIDTPESLAYLQNIQTTFGESVHIFAYVAVTDGVVEQRTFPNEIFGLLSQLPSVDRLQMLDKSDKLHTESFISLKEQLGKISPSNKKVVGACSSAMSFGDHCCLTAMRLRDLQSYKEEQMELPLASKNHQVGCENSCGCVKYITIGSDFDVLQTKKGKTKSSGESTGGSKSKNSKKNFEMPIGNNF